MKGNLLFLLIKVLSSDVSTSSKESNAKRNLLTSSTYRLNENDKNDPLVGFKVLYRYLRTKRQPLPKAERGGDWIHNSSAGSEELRRAYLNDLGVKVSGYVAKNQLAPISKNFLSCVLLSLLIGLFTGVICLVRSKGRVQKALLPIEMAELLAFKKLLLKFKADHVHDFANFEIDSNLMTLVCQGLGISVSKYPSPGPLGLHNRFLVADTLCYNHEYHRDEIANFKSIIADEYKQVPIEFYPNYKDVYKDGTARVKPKTEFGFYSHGSLVRSVEGHTKSDMNILGKEREALVILNELLKGSKAGLIIYVHPRELKSGIDKAKAFYQELLPDIDFMISDDGLSNARKFAEVNVGIGVYSAILFERMSLGFKTWFYIDDQQNRASFPLAESNLRKSCFRSKEEFQELQASVKL